MLRVLLQERDLNTFQVLLEKFLSYCQESPDTTEFGNYFVINYSSKVKQWAYCHRLQSGLNTNMHIGKLIIYFFVMKFINLIFFCIFRKDASYY